MESTLLKKEHNPIIQSYHWEIESKRFWPTISGQHIILIKYVTSDHTVWPYIIYAQIFSINPCCFVLQPPMERNSKKTTSPPHVSISLVPFWCLFVLSKRNQFILLSCIVCQLCRNPRIDLSGSLRCTKLRPRIILTPINAKCKVDYSEEEKDGKIWTVDVLFFI